MNAEIEDMNPLKQYADQVKFISEEMKAGNISMTEGAIRLQAVAVFVEQDAEIIEDERAAERMRKFADMIYGVLDKMKPDRRVMQ